MNRNRVLVAGLVLLLTQAGCSKDKKVVNVVGSYAPVIMGVSVDHEPAIRAQGNVLTLEVTNVNAVPLAYHWRVDSGELEDSTAQSVTWIAPDSIGTAHVYVSITGKDENGVEYFRERTFPMYVDNEFTRWTSGETVKFDVAPQLGEAVGPGRPLVYAELENPSTGESRLLALDQAMGSPVSLADPFFSASGPSISFDNNWVAFAGRTVAGRPGNSIFTIPATGAGPDTTTALPIARYVSNSVTILAHPRFARTSHMLAYNSDETATGSPQIYVREGTNLNIPASRLSFEYFQTYWMPGWSSADTTILCEKYQNFRQANQTHEGVWRVSSTPPIPPPPPYLEQPARPWLELDATECDWSVDGQYVVFARRNDAGERDLWIIRADTADPARAVRVTRGPADDSHPRFSHDGTTVYFVSNRADRYGLNGVFETERRGYNIWSVKAFDLPQ